MGSVVVTGASAGVGRAVARAFARRGWRVGLIARGEDGLEGARRDVVARGGQALVLPADVADAAAVGAAADRAAAEFGGIDVWVNSAMATTFSPVEETPAEEIRRVTEVTYLGAVHGTLAALRHMRAAGDRGTVVQVGSALSYRAIPLQASYCGAKFAIRGFTDALRSELIHRGSGIRLTMVQLPAVNTPQFDWARSRLPRRLQPVPPIHAPEVAGEAIWRAAMRAPREIWLGWPSLRAILGTMLAPGLLDRFLASAAWDGQMTSEPASPGRADNLLAPVPGDHGAAGRFGDRVRASAPAFDPAMLRIGAGATVAAVALAAVATALTHGRGRHRALPLFPPRGWRR